MQPERTDRKRGLLAEEPAWRRYLVIVLSFAVAAIVLSSVAPRLPFGLGGGIATAFYLIVFRIVFGRLPGDRR